MMPGLVQEGFWLAGTVYETSTSEVWKATEKEPGDLLLVLQTVTGAEGKAAVGGAGGGSPERGRLSVWWDAGSSGQRPSLPCSQWALLSSL